MPSRMIDYACPTPHKYVSTSWKKIKKIQPLSKFDQSKYLQNTNKLLTKSTKQQLSSATK